MQRSGDGDHQGMLSRVFFQELFDHGFSSAWHAHQKTEAALVVVDSERVINILLCRQERQVLAGEGVFG